MSILFIFDFFDFLAAISRCAPRVSAYAMFSPREARGGASAAFTPDISLIRRATLFAAILMPLILTPFRQPPCRLRYFFDYFAISPLFAIIAITPYYHYFFFRRRRYADAYSTPPLRRRH
jgi:hypothetical protein